MAIWNRRPGLVAAALVVAFAALLHLILSSKSRDHLTRAEDLLDRSLWGWTRGDADE
jgi:hypothetical protein